MDKEPTLNEVVASFDMDRALVGKFKRVFDEIYEDLLKSAFIAH